ncbi:hypothetical protein DXG01_008583, partial [Tephrocybe rancida]
QRLPLISGPISNELQPLQLSSPEDPMQDMYKELGNSINLDTPLDTIPISYSTARVHTILVNISKEELQRWTVGYQNTPHYSEVMKEWKKEENWNNPKYPQYHFNDEGLTYFEDWQGTN